MKGLSVAIFMATLSCSVYGQSISKTMKHLPDTGDTIGYTATYGEDNDFSIFQPFFIDNGDGTVTDTVTGLMWQKTDGGEMTIERARIYCDSLTLAGHTNWRLPNPYEGFSILNLNRLNPAMDTSFFPNSVAEYWWTGVMDISDTAKQWATNAGGGIGNHPRAETISAGGIKRFHARAVRDITSPPVLPAHFTDNGNGTVTDNLTALTWLNSPLPDTMAWEQALTGADTCTIGGYTDWRMPNIKELQSVTDFTMFNPAFSPLFTAGAGNRFYWSSTTQYNNAPNAWHLSSQHGITTYITKTRHIYALLVRGNTTTLAANNTALNQAIEATSFPNPAFGKVTICCVLSNSKRTTLTIVNAMGQIIHEQTCDGCKDGLNTWEWRTDDAPQGLYFYRVCTERNDFSFHTYTGKIVLGS